MALFFGIIESVLAGVFPQIVPGASTATTGIVFIVVLGIVLKFVVATKGAGIRFRL